MPDADLRPLRIVLAEDALLLREGLVSILERAGHTVVAAVGDLQSLESAIAEHDPDVVITDIRMPPTNTDEGISVAADLRVRKPDTGVLWHAPCEARCASARTRCPSARR